MPLVLVSIMKLYLPELFDYSSFMLLFYALAFKLCQTDFQSSSFSALAGNMYDSIGFYHTYLILGAIVAVVTIFAAFTLKKEDPVQAGEVDKEGNTKA